MTIKLDHIDHWIFDLDNTLYSGDAAFFSQIDKKMTAYISDYLQLDPPDARKIQKQFLAEYGTSLSGLMAVHGMDPAPFLDFVHDVDLGHLDPCPDLPTAISTLPGKKYIFTNGSQKHAENVGKHLGIYDLFDGVFGIEDVDYVPKPQRSPYVKFCDVFDVEPSRAIMFEDSVRNLEVPKFMGMSTVLVTSDADWSHEPQHARPASAETSADWVDHMTDNLASWLNTNS
ncbi:MAG: pyrimidine 5'-nucleotidase [Hellea sp.]|nr:pyrimidine 5'-nucleotidase [Hellea sp.]